MKYKLLILFFLLIILIIITFHKYTDDKINYTILGDKYYFSNNLYSKNYSDLLAEKLKDKNMLKSYSKDFIYNDIRVTDLYSKIKNNELKNDNSIQNVINRTDLLILNIGNSEINYKIKNKDYDDINDIEIYKYLDELEKDINKLLDEIEKISDTKIIFIGFFNETNNSYNDKYYQYVNKKLSKNKKINFLNLYNILNMESKNLEKNTKVYINNRGNMSIYNKILKKVNLMYLKK